MKISLHSFFSGAENKMHPRNQLGLGNVTEIPCSAACPASQTSALAVLHMQLVLWGDKLALLFPTLVWQTLRGFLPGLVSLQCFFQYCLPPALETRIIPSTRKVRRWLLPPAAASLGSRSSWELLPSRRP